MSAHLAQVKSTPVSAWHDSGYVWEVIKVILPLADLFGPSNLVFAGNKDGGSTAVRFPARRSR